MRPHPPHAVAWRGKVLLARLCVHQPSVGKRELAPPCFAYSNCASKPTSRGSVEGQGHPCPNVRPATIGGQAGARPSRLRLKNCASSHTSRGSVEGQGPPCPMVRPPDHRRARGSLPLQASPIQTVRPHSPHAVAWRGKVLLARLCVQQPSAGKRELAPPGFAYSNCPTPRSRSHRAARPAFRSPHAGNRS